MTIVERLRNPLLGLLFVFLVQVIIATAISILGSSIDLSPASYFYYLKIGGYLVTTIFLVVFWRSDRLIIKAERLNIKGIGVLLLADFVILMFITLPKIPVSTNVPVYTLMVISPILLSPVFEELLFRSFFMENLIKRNVNVYLNITISTLLFGGMHYTNNIFIHLASGLLYSVAYAKYRNVYLNIFIHTLHNTIILACQYGYIDSIF